MAEATLSIIAAGSIRYNFIIKTFFLRVVSKPERRARKIEFSGANNPRLWVGRTNPLIGDGASPLAGLRSLFRAPTEGRATPHVSSMLFEPSQSLSL